MKDKEIIISAQKLLKEKRYIEAIKMTNNLKSHNEQMVAATNKIKGWCYYYAYKEDENKKTENLEKAEEHFRLALIKMKNIKGVISLLNGLPLVLWMQNKKEEAWEVMDKAIKEFPETVSLWNTRRKLYDLENNFNQPL